jgi:hypothetical protein
VWVDPAVNAKLGDAAFASLDTPLRSCAATQDDLPASCKAGDEFVTRTKSGPNANCHWQCGSPCSEHRCFWRVNAGAWSLKDWRLAGAEIVQRKACGQNWQTIFDHPALYEEMSCEAECFQVFAIKALSKTNPECAMELSGVISSRPACYGSIPTWCRSSGNEGAVEEPKR